MKTFVIRFNGKTPSGQEREQLLQDPFDKTPFSFVERNRKIIEGFLCFPSGIGCVIFSWFLFLSKIAFRYPMGGAFIAALFGFGLSLFYQGINCFRNRPTKNNLQKSQQAIHQYVKCLLDTNYFHIGTTDIGNSYAALQRMLPESQRVTYETFTAYSTDFHLKMMAIVKNDAKTLNLPENGFKVSSVNTSVVSTEAVSQGVEKLTMEVNLYVENTQVVPSIWRDKFVLTKVSHIKLIFTMTLVQSNKYWFVYNPLPDYQIDKLDTTLN
jgi:hypothetical protein